MEHHTQLEEAKLNNGIEAIRPDIAVLIGTMEAAFEGESLSPSEIIIVSRLSASWKTELAISSSQYEPRLEIDSLPARSIVEQLTFSHWWKIFGAVTLAISAMYAVAHYSVSHSLKKNEIDIERIKANYDNEVSKTKLLEKSIQLKNDEISTLDNKLNACSKKTKELIVGIELCNSQKEPDLTKK